MANCGFLEAHSVKFFVALAVAILSALPGAAATIDFNSLASGANGSAGSVPGARIILTGDGTLYAYHTAAFGMPPGGGICAESANGSCTGRVTIIMIGPIANLTFNGYFVQAGDSATASVYSGTTLLATRTIGGLGTTSVSFSGLSGITRLSIADTSAPGASGIAFGSFQYDPAPATSVAAPPPPTPRTISFDGLAQGSHTSPLQFADLLIAGLNGSDLYVYHSGQYGMPAGGGTCALKANFTCTGDLELAFLLPISGLTFNGYFAAASDSVLISLFSGSTLLFSQQYWGNSTGTLFFDLSAFSKIDLVTIQDRSTLLTKGMAFGNFRYSYWQPPVVVPPPPPPATVPQPGSWLFALTEVLAGLSLAAFRRRARRAHRAVPA